jgi:beta-glucuronidase
MNLSQTSKPVNRFIQIILLLVIAVASIPLQATAENIPDLYLHGGQSLDGAWHIIVDPYDSGFYDYRYHERDLDANPSRAETFYLDLQPANDTERMEYDFATSPTLNVPGDWNTQKPELFYYEGSLWYERKFVSASPTPGERAFLRFGAANYRADVYLNGQKLGTHIGGFTPFSFEITQKLKPGTNSLVVRVNNQRSRDGVPTLNTDWWNYGGLTREVRLVYTPATFIADHRLWLESETNNMISGWVQLAGAGGGQTVQLSIAGLGCVSAGDLYSRRVSLARRRARELSGQSPPTPELGQGTGL